MKYAFCPLHFIVKIVHFNRYKNISSLKSCISSKKVVFYFQSVVCLYRSFRTRSLTGCNRYRKRLYYMKQNKRLKQHWIHICALTLKR